MVFGFAGIDIDVMGVTMNLHGTQLEEEHQATILKGYALTFVTAHTTGEDHDAEKSILNTLTFDH